MTGREYLAAHNVDLAVAEGCGVEVGDWTLGYLYTRPDGSGYRRVRHLVGDRSGRTMQPEGERLRLYWPAGRRGGAILLAEGEPDALAALSALRAKGEQPPVLDGLGIAAVPGTGMPADRAAEELRAAGAEVVYLVLDADDAGRQAADRLAEALGEVGIDAPRPPLPDGRDLADVLAAAENPTRVLADLLVQVEAVEAVDRAGRLPWRWANELAAAAPDEPAWVFEGYVSAGAKTLLAGLPKGGKTTLIAALIEAVASAAQSFLGRRVGGGPVVLASEEGDSTLGPKLRGLPDGRVRVLNRDAAWPKPPWADLIGGAVREAEAIGATLLVIDSMAFWAALEPEREKDSGAAQAIMDALDEATRAGLAVLLVHHQRKARGDHGTGVRGSTALAGAVDVVVEYERLGEDAPRSQRRLVALSRWPATPDVLVLDYHVGEGTWRVIGEAEGRAESEGVGVRELVLTAVPTELPGITEDEVVGLLGLHKKKIGGPLRELVDEGAIERAGKGVKGQPFRYRRNAVSNAVPAADGIADSDAALPHRGTASNPVSIPDAAPEGPDVSGPGEVEDAAGAPAPSIGEAEIRAMGLDPIGRERGG